MIVSETFLRDSAKLVAAGCKMLLNCDYDTVLEWTSKVPLFKNYKLNIKSYDLETCPDKNIQTIYFSKILLEGWLWFNEIKMQNYSKIEQKYFSAPIRALLLSAETPSQRKT